MKKVILLVRNLFIMHTQYNLILACGLVKENYKNDINDLILNSEFKIIDEHKNNLQKVFSNILYIQEDFSEEKNIVQREKNHFVKYNKISGWAKESYGNVFLSQEQYIDTLIISKLSKQGKFKCIDIEEDAYFSLNDKNNSKDDVFLIKKNFDCLTWKGKLLQEIKDLIYGKNLFYYNVYCYGMSPIYSEVYAIFPKLVRDELKFKIINEVTCKMIVAGVNSLFSSVKYELVKSDVYVLFFFDLLSRYSNLNSIEKIVMNIIKICSKYNIVFLYKYHPREDGTIRVIEDHDKCIKLPTVVPSEKILVDLLGKKIFVFGNTTTAIQVSAKLGFNTISIAKINELKNESAINAFIKMGIQVPNDIEEINDHLEVNLKGENQL